jgi:hypothetical protein
MTATRIFWISTLAVALALSGCAIKNQHGKEVFRVDVKAGEEGQGSQPKPTPTPAPTPAPTPEPKPDKTGAPDKSGTAGKAAAPAEGVDTPADAAAAPWWKTGIKSRDLGENGGEPEGGDFADAEPTTDAPGLVAADIDDSDPEPADDEETPPETVAPPEKRTVAVDRDLQPVPHEQWSKTLQEQTGKAAKPDRKASMSNVQKAVESGYGTAYVSHLEKAITLDRTNGYAYYFLARGRFDKSDWNGAKGFADKAVQQLASDPVFRSRARVLYAKVLANSGDQVEASRQADLAMIDDPENTEARILSLKLR